MENGRGTGTVTNNNNNNNKRKELEGFGNLFNEFQFNQSCMIVTIIFIICFRLKMIL